MANYLEVSVTVLTSHNATVAEVDLVSEIVKQGDGYVAVTLSATGSAKRDPGDKQDVTIGTDLATGRALESLGRKLQRRANGRVSAASEAKRVKAEAKATRENQQMPLDEYTSALVAALADNGFVVLDYDDDGHRAF